MALCSLCVLFSSVYSVVNFLNSFLNFDLQFYILIFDFYFLAALPR